MYEMLKEINKIHCKNHAFNDIWFYVKSVFFLKFLNEWFQFLLNVQVYWQVQFTLNCSKQSYWVLTINYRHLLIRNNFFKLRFFVFKISFISIVFRPKYTMYILSVLTHVESCIFMFLRHIIVIKIYHANLHISFYSL